MLRDGGVWAESPFYPIRHQCLLVMAQLSRYRGLYDGVDWFRHKAPGGGSLQGLLDYYVASAYPIEREGSGPGRIRCATYGDGATTVSGGDLFLADQFEPPQPVTFNGTGLAFPIGSFTGDRWSVGFCRPGELDAWRANARD